MSKNYKIMLDGKITKMQSHGVETSVEVEVDSGWGRLVEGLVLSAVTVAMEGESSRKKADMTNQIVDMLVAEYPSFKIVPRDHSS